MNHLPKKTRKPVFCKNCEILALAMLDDAPLCTGCLMCAIGNRADPELLDRIKPLSCNQTDTGNDAQTDIR